MIFATESVVSSTDWSSVMTALSAQINVATVVGVLTSLVSAGIGLVFMWWGVRLAFSFSYEKLRNS